MIEVINPLNAELNPICQLLALLGTHPILHVSKVRVNKLSFLHLVGCLYYCINEARSHKHQTHLTFEHRTTAADIALSK